MQAEGKNPVGEALASSKTIEKLLVQDKIGDTAVRELIKKAKDRGVLVEFVPKPALDRLSKTGHHQGIIAILSEFEYSSLEDVINIEGKRRFYILLDKITDPHNLGSIIRTAECAGVSAVIIPERDSVLVNETVIRSSAGATSHVKVCKVKNINDAIRKLKDNNIFVYVTDMDGEIMYRCNLTGDIAIVIGSEGKGVSSLTRSLADGVVGIPMFGKVNSLNASVSAGIVVYESVRQSIIKEK